jgi:hypothetical protein
LTTEDLIRELKAITTFLEHHTDALESGDFGEYSLMPLESLSQHVLNAERGLDALKAKIDEEVTEITHITGPLKDPGVKA